MEKKRKYTTLDVMREVVKELDRTKGPINIQKEKPFQSFTDNPGMQMHQNIQTGALHVSEASRKTKKQIAADEYAEWHQEEVKRLVEEGRKKGMVQGLCLAINYMYRGNDEAAIWRAAGLTIQECIDNEVDIFDMEKLLEHRKELEG